MFSFILIACPHPSEKRAGEVHILGVENTSVGIPPPPGGNGFQADAQNSSLTLTIGKQGMISTSYNNPRQNADATFQEFLHPQEMLFIYFNPSKTDVTLTGANADSQQISNFMRTLDSLKQKNCVAVLFMSGSQISGAQPASNPRRHTYDESHEVSDSRPHPLIFTVHRKGFVKLCYVDLDSTMQAILAQ